MVFIDGDVAIKGKLSLADGLCLFMVSSSVEVASVRVPDTTCGVFERKSIELPVLAKKEEGKDEDVSPGDFKRLSLLTVDRVNGMFVMKRVSVDVS